MDGFHRDNSDLERSGLLSRKGAPQTFDVAGLLSVLERVQDADGTAYPTFDRSQDCTVPDAGTIAATDETVVVEGNYLLLKQSPWDQLHRFWDFSILLDVPLPVLEDRLIQRWVKHGHSIAEATDRARHNDLVNAETVATSSARPNLKLNNAS